MTLPMGAREATLTPVIVVESRSPGSLRVICTYYCLSRKPILSPASVGEHGLALVVGAPQMTGLAGRESAVPFALLRRPILRLTRPWRSRTACTVLIAGVCTSG